LAYDPQASYLIISLEEETPTLKAFGIKDGVATLQTLEVIE
jgi:hypothetical protein